MNLATARADSGPIEWISYMAPDKRVIRRVEFPPNLKAASMQFLLLLRGAMHQFCKEAGAIDEGAMYRAYYNLQPLLECIRGCCVHTITTMPRRS